MTEQVGAASDALPEYPVAELRGDLHHLLSPMIGRLRLEDVEANAHQIERLRLALALADVAAGDCPVRDVPEIVAMRSRHGAGTFASQRGVSLLAKENDR